MALHGKPFPAPGHNHVACLNQTLERAKSAFETQGLRLTDLRLKVFREIAASHHAVGAYDIIERLSRSGGPRLAPVSVYRAIDALIEAGVVHRLESKNAYFACHANHAGRQNVVMSCTNCGTVAEIDGAAVFDAIDALAAIQKFEQASRMVEITGRCAHCAA